MISEYVKADLRIASVDVQTQLALPGRWRQKLDLCDYPETLLLIETVTATLILKTGSIVSPPRLNVQAEPSSPP